MFFTKRSAFIHILIILSCTQCRFKFKSEPKAEQEKFYDALENFPEGSGYSKEVYCRTNPMTGGLFVENLLVLDPTQEIDFKTFGKDEQSKKRDFLVWRSVCGPLLKNINIDSTTWNTHPAICRYKKTDEKIKIEVSGQFSHNVKFRPDTQYYFGYLFEESESGFDLNRSYFYSSENKVFHNLKENIQHPVIYSIFKNVCDKVQRSRGGVCPLPRTLDDIKSKLNFLRKQTQLAKKTSEDLLREFGLSLESASSNEASPIAGIAQILAQQVAYQCLEQAVKEADSIGLASHTYIPTIESVYEEFDEQAISVDRIKIYGHHWNVYKPKISRSGDEIVVCGHLDHNIRYNKNDSVDYRFVFKDGVIKDRKIEIDDVNVIAKVNSIADKFLTFYDIYTTTVGQGIEFHSALSKANFKLLVDLAARTEKLVYGDWQIAGEQLSEVLATIAKDKKYIEGRCDLGHSVK